MASCPGPARPAAAALAIAAALSAQALAPSSVPESMLPLPGLLNFDFASTKLQKIESKFDPVSQKTVAIGLESISAKSVIDKYASDGGKGTVCFVVRRPGWVLCREEGIALHELAAQSDDFKGISLFGVVKEINVDDEGLLEFQSKYYPHDLYLDSDLSFYAALGDRKLSIPLRTLINPFKAYGYMKTMNKRLKAKAIEGNFKGEGLKKGGVIVFDREGDVKYAYLEETGNELPVADILSAVRDVTGRTKKETSSNAEL